MKGAEAHTTKPYHRLYIGIDPGLDGGLAAINDEGYIGELSPMPTRKVAKGRRVDERAVQDWLRNQVSTHANTVVILEDPGGHAPSAAGLRSMTHSFAVMETLIRIDRLSYHLVDAKEWQKMFWPRAKGTDTKAASIDTACKIWPEQPFLASSRSRKMHDGMTDSLLIAEWGRRYRL